LPTFILHLHFETKISQGILMRNLIQIALEVHGNLTQFIAQYQGSLLEG